MTPDKKLDNMLSSLTPPTPGAALKGRILADFRAEQQRFSWRGLPNILWPFGPIWQPVAALVLVAVLGMNVTLPTGYDAQTTQLAEADFSALVLGRAYTAEIETGETL